MHLTREERETIIRFDEAGEFATVYTYNSRLKKRLGELVAEDVQGVKLQRSHQEISAEGATYEIPKACVRINPTRKCAPLTETQKAARAEALRNARQNRAVQEG